VKQRAAN